MDFIGPSPFGLPSPHEVAAELREVVPLPTRLGTVPTPVVLLAALAGGASLGATLGLWGTSPAFAASWPGPVAALAALRTTQAAADKHSQN